MMLKAIVLFTLLLLFTTAVLAQSSDWAQWGGPHRNFISDTKGLATSWPATGPRRLWQRELGEGYSAIAVEHGMLFTMYRKGENEIAIALDAVTGKTIWEYSYAAPFTAIDVKTGKIVWRHRSFPRASFLFADGRFIILDEDGHLLLATATPEGLTVTSKVELLSNQSWTIPSLSGTRLYLRDRKNIIALELGPQ